MAEILSRDTIAVSFKNRVAIITGAGGGLGRTYALEIARRGGAVVVNDLGGSVEGPGDSRSMADQVVEDIIDGGGKALANYDTVASREGAQRIAQAAIDEFGRIDALINNAGNMRYKRFEDFTDEDLSAVLSVHLVGTFNVTQAVWPYMKAQGYGRIVSTSSSAGMYGDDGYACYASAKAGITGLMNVLSHEGKPHGIFCNVLMPNAITRMTDNVSAQMDKGEMEQSMALMKAIKNSMEPRFTTALAVFLASEACNSTKAIYSSCAGRMARVIIGATDGWHGPQETPPTAEDIASHFDTISDLSGGVHMPETPGDEFSIVLTRREPVV